MPIPISRKRKESGPWIIVEVPMETDDLKEDQLYPSRRRFYSTIAGDGQSEFIDQAHQFSDRKDAQSLANKLMHRSRNTWAEVVPLSIAWALVNSCGAPWSPRAKVA